MKYTFSFKYPHHHFIDIEFSASGLSGEYVDLQLPSWRPGRYELGDFAKNVQQFEVFDKKNNEKRFQKLNKDRWRVFLEGSTELVVRYNYFANVLNAGSTYLGDELLYVNPVNCCFYIVGREKEACKVVIHTPWKQEVATGMQRDGISEIGDLYQHKFKLNDFDELADSPFMAAKTLQHNMFVLDGVEFHLWFHGECKPDWPKLINDFFIFVNEQFVMMKEFPVPVFHFLFQIAPYRFYHGVEHLTSTVISLGPGYEVMKGDLYNSLLGVSSHELFHVWNVKSIRPIEMHPYDYTKENYARTGYVYEGATTYYGDLLLYRSGIFSDEEYFKELSLRMQLHFDNHGRYNLSVADSSFDTWLDGYVPGIPNRKTSIYHEGCLVSFMLDMLIRKHSKNKHSLDDVLRELYHVFSKKNKGYSEEEYKKISEKYASVDLTEFFEKYVYGANSYELGLEEALAHVGCEMTIDKSTKYNESLYGIRIADEKSNKVVRVYPGSPAYEAGIMPDDLIQTINGIKIEGNLNEWCAYFEKKEIVSLGLVSAGELKQINLKASKTTFFDKYSVKKKEEVSNEAKEAFKIWVGRNH